jgi:hypothetical protein
VIENADAPSQFSYVTYHQSGGSVNEEATSVREKYRQYFENVESVPWQLEVITRGRAVQK